MQQIYTHYGAEMQRAKRSGIDGKGSLPRV